MYMYWCDFVLFMYYCIMIHVDLYVLMWLCIVYVKNGEIKYWFIIDWWYYIFFVFFIAGSLNKCRYIFWFAMYCCNNSLRARKYPAYEYTHYISDLSYWWSQGPLNHREQRSMFISSLRLVNNPALRVAFISSLRLVNNPALRVAFISSLRLVNNPALRVAFVSSLRLVNNPALRVAFVSSLRSSFDQALL